MLNVRKFVLALALLALITLSSTAAAAPVVFTDRTAFNTAITGSQRFDEKFQSFTLDTPFRTAPVNVNGNFTLLQVNLSGPPSVFRNLIDVPPFASVEHNGTSYASMYTNFGGTAIDLTFTNPVYAFGGDFFGAASGEMLDIDLFTDSSVFFATLSVTVNTGFYGFVNTSTSEAIGRIRFRSRVNIPGSFGEGFGLDNVTGVLAQREAIPEPTTVLLLGTGLAGVAGAVRRRRKAKKSAEA